LLVFCKIILFNDYLTFFIDCTIVSRTLLVKIMMNQPKSTYKTTTEVQTNTHNAFLIKALFAGLLLPLGFAPFHLAGLSILGLALFFALLKNSTLKQSLAIGFFFGVGYFGFGISWIYVSIHLYGHLIPPIAAIITGIFVFYLALFTASLAVLYSMLSRLLSPLLCCLLFGALWTGIEYFRSHFLSGFPWLLIGFSQIDTPLKFLLPIIGVYGVGFFSCFAATSLTYALFSTGRARLRWVITFVSVLLAPSLLNNVQWTSVSRTPLSVGIVQADVSMRDKWDDDLFLDLVTRYREGIEALMKNDLIILPESAFPIPAHYIHDLLDRLDREANHSKTAILIGIPQAADEEETTYYNSLISLGFGKGEYLKQHLVPFGEYTPHFFEKIFSWFNIPASNFKPGSSPQSLIEVHHHPIAALICYELAYPHLLRQQLPQAEWIVSVSDDGWFGHSLAMYQQQQMAQVLSLQTGRFQVVANNDGLSSIIDEKGNLTSSLPTFTSGLLEGLVYPATGFSPWVCYGDNPILFLCFLIVFVTAIAAKYKRRYPKKLI